ncbi:MAG: hypothetical protein QOD87_1256, partial [Pseudonocardiales bacterium]|nr:hypothetical protein [Pseudonocardiales bacterium]
MSSEQLAQNPLPSTRRRREPSLSPPSYVLNKHGSRVLDPDSALRITGQRVRPTVYVGASLLVQASDLTETLRSELQRAANQFNLRLGEESTDVELLNLAAEVDAGLERAKAAPDRGKSSPDQRDQWAARGEDS